MTPLLQQAHRPWPIPKRRWIWRQSWCDLLFAHWPIEASQIRRLVPEPLQIDEFDGTSWIGIVPFRMEGVMRRPFPDMPWISAFPELNLRLYVHHQGKPGVWFLSLDATNPLAVWAADDSFICHTFAPTSLLKKGLMLFTIALAAMAQMRASKQSIALPPKFASHPPAHCPIGLPNGTVYTPKLLLVLYIARKFTTLRGPCNPPALPSPKMNSLSLLAYVSLGSLRMYTLLARSMSLCGDRDVSLRRKFCAHSNDDSLNQ